MSFPAISHARLVDTGTALFYTEGISATGVDMVVARSEFSKSTLHAHLRSKDELAAAVLERRRAERVAMLDAWVQTNSDSPLEQLLAVSAWLANRHVSEGRRGFPFFNTVAEVADSGHPAHEVARRHKRWMREDLAGLASEAGFSDPQRLGCDLKLLIDDANARVLVGGDLAAAKDSRRRDDVLVDARRERRQ